MINNTNTVDILEKSLVSHNIKSINKILDCLSPTFNYWSFMVVMIRKNINIVHFDYIIKKIFTKLDNINNYPEYIYEICKELKAYEGSYYIDKSKVKEHYRFYDKILGIIKQCGLDLNSQVNYRFSILNHADSELLKIGINME